MQAVGTEVFKRYQNWQLQNDETDTAEKILDAIEKHLTPEVNKRYERFVFNSAFQKEDENIDTYIDRLRGLIKNCQYGEIEDELLLDRLIVSIHDVKLRQRLWEKDTITLLEAINTCRSSEQSRMQLKKLQNPEEINVVSTKKQSKYEKNNDRSRNKSRNRSQSRIRNQSKQGKTLNDFKIIENCSRCGETHLIKKCPAWKHKCKKCGISNHYDFKCKSKNTRKIETIDSDDNDVL